MSTVQSKYGTNNQAITCTLTSLANNGQRGSAAIDNTTNLFLDALVFLKLKSGGSGTLTAGYVNVYAYGTADGGTTYSDGVSGTDAGQTLTSPPNLRLIGVINMVANSVVYDGGPFSVAAAFGGILPDHWGIVVENKSGGTCDGTTATSWCQGGEAQVA